MTEAKADLYKVLDQSVLVSLRQLQDEGDPDIVAEVGGLFLQHAHRIGSGRFCGHRKKRCKGPAARSA